MIAYRLPAFLTITGQINIRSTSSSETWSQSLNTEGCEAGFFPGLPESEAEVSSCKLESPKRCKNASVVAAQSAVTTGNSSASPIPNSTPTFVLD